MPEQLINLCLSSVDNMDEEKAFEQCKAALMKYACNVASLVKEVNYGRGFKQGGRG